MGRIFRITTRLDDQSNSFKGQTFLQVANKTTIFKLVECFFFFLQSGNLMWTYLPMGSRSKDIGYSLTLETVSWIIQQLKHHFALNAEIPNRFSENLFHISNCSRKQPEAIYFVTLWRITVKLKNSWNWVLGLQFNWKYQ